jgi:hypothetical protein
VCDCSCAVLLWLHVTILPVLSSENPFLSAALEVLAPRCLGHFQANFQQARTPVPCLSFHCPVTCGCRVGYLILGFGVTWLSLGRFYSSWWVFGVEGNLKHWLLSTRHPGQDSHLFGKMKNVYFYFPHGGKFEGCCEEPGGPTADHLLPLWPLLCLQTRRPLPRGAKRWTWTSELMSLCGLILLSLLPGALRERTVGWTDLLQTSVECCPSAAPSPPLLCLWSSLTAPRTATVQRGLSTSYKESSLPRLLLVHKIPVLFIYSFLCS